MAKSMRRIVIVAILLIALAGAACFAVLICSTDTPFEGARTATLNTIIDNTGVKDRVKTALSNKASDVAEKYGVPEELVDAGMDMLAIEDWKVTETPANAAVEKTVEMDVGGSPVQITTYDDKSIVSLKGEGKLNTFGQTITFKIPESAQGIADLLPYLDATEDVEAADLISRLIGSQE